MMKKQTPIDSEALACEIRRYLVAVDVFRAERCEPAWLPEPTPCLTSQERLQARAEHAPSAH